MDKVEHIIVADWNVVVSLWHGEPDDASMLQSYRDLYMDPLWKPGMNELLDMRIASLRLLSGDGIREAGEITVAALKDSDQEMKTAALVAGDLEWGIVRMYQALASETPETVQVFRDLDETLAWLELSQQIFEHVPQLRTRA